MLSDNKLLQVLCSLRDNESVTFSSSMYSAVQITLRAKVRGHEPLTLSTICWLDKENLTLDHPFEIGPMVLTEAIEQLRRSVVAHESL